MSLADIPDLVKFILSGTLGALFTYGATWVRERRRTLDTYRAPQRQALGDIIAATYEYRLRELDQRMLTNELVELIRKQESSTVLNEQLRAAAEASARASLGVERAFRVAQLTVVDAPCWEAMGAAYLMFDRVKSGLRSVGPNPQMATPEEIEQYVGARAKLVEEFGTSVDLLTPAANNRLIPAAETWRNRIGRRRARGRLGKFYRQLHADETPAPEAPPQPHY